MRVRESRIADGIASSFAGSAFLESAKKMAGDFVRELSSDFAPSPFALWMTATLLLTALPSWAETGWVLVQHTPVGTYNVFIGKGRVLAAEVKTRYSIVSKAPDWNVYAYRKDCKTICKIHPDLWQMKGLFTMNERSLVKPVSKSIKPKKKVLSKLKYLEYRLPIKNTRRFSKGRIVDIRGFMDPDGEVKTIHSTHANFLVSPEISQNKRIATFLGSLFVVPVGDGAPINFSIKYDNGTDHSPLMTSRIRQANFSDSLFSVPEGYKNVKHVQEITTGHRSGEIDDMIKDLGLGDSFGGKIK